MHHHLRKADSFQSNKPLYNANYGDVKTSGIAKLKHIPDTNRKKRDEATNFFEQEKLLIEYWVSFDLNKKITEKSRQNHELILFGFELTTFFIHANISSLLDNPYLPTRMAASVS